MPHRVCAQIGALGKVVPEKPVGVPYGGRALIGGGGCRRRSKLDEREERTGDSLTCLMERVPVAVANWWPDPEGSSSPVPTYRSFVPALSHSCVHRISSDIGYLVLCLAVPVEATTENGAVGRIFRHVKLRPRHAHFRGRRWEVHDFDSLARAIADLALGQCAHVEKLLRSSDAWQPVGATYAIDAAIKSLTVPPGSKPWHRDGWVFQLISWIAAIEESDGLTRVPQMDQASKGFDGLQLEMNPSTNGAKRAIIFEDKATDSPRTTVRDKVWPEFADIDAGNRHPALAAEIGALLRGRDEAEITSSIDQILRDPAGLAYRASITAGKHHARAAGFNGLFDGFKTSVRGRRRRRRGNVFEVDDLRGWMDSLCSRAIELLEADRV